MYQQSRLPAANHAGYLLSMLASWWLGRFVDRIKHLRLVLNKHIYLIISVFSFLWIVDFKGMSSCCYGVQLGLDVLFTFPNKRKLNSTHEMLMGFQIYRFIQLCDFWYVSAILNGFHQCRGTTQICLSAPFWHVIPPVKNRAMSDPIRPIKAHLHRMVFTPHIISPKAQRSGVPFKILFYFQPGIFIKLLKILS